MAREICNVESSQVLRQKKEEKEKERSWNLDIMDFLLHVMGVLFLKFLSVSQFKMHLPLQSHSSCCNLNGSMAYFLQVKPFVLEGAENANTNI